MSHTPGPWIHAPLSDAIITPRGVAVAEPPDGYDEEQWQADAALIAAAPDLLDALKALRKNVDVDLSGYWTESTSNFMQQADAAIAKAEGRTTEKRESAQPCGCDPAAGWTCEAHREAVRS